MKKFNITLAITLIISWTFLLISYYMKDQTWLFGIDRINIGTMTFIFINFYTLPTMVWEHRGIEEERKHHYGAISDDLYRMREMIKYKAVAGIVAGFITIL